MKNRALHTTIFSLILVFQFQYTYTQKHLNEGNKYFDRNLFEDAIPYYLKELEKGDSYKAKNEAREKLASCYRLTGRFLEANEIYKTILDRSFRFNKSENVLNYANSLKSSALYEEAAEQFKNYIKLEPDDPMGEIYLESCYKAQKWLDEPDKFMVTNFNELNTPETDFAPTYYKDGIVITSSREGSKKRFINISNISDEVSTDLYYVNLNDAYTEGFQEHNMDMLNTFVHDGAATFSQDGREVYFTRTVMGEKKRKGNVILNSLQILYSKKDKEGNWSEPVSAFSFNSEEYSVGQPSLSPDGKTIYFISDMPGGFGKTDIYYAKRHAEGEWSEPINVGKPINTFGYELGPFAASNDTLLFSSDTHPGMGKMDIFYCIKKDGEWGEVVNMKPPINSIGDDLGITLDASHNRGLFSSDRFNGHGKEDIYTFSNIDHPLELYLYGNRLEIADYSIYNGLSFKIAKENGNAKDMKPVNGIFSQQLEEDSLYHLNVRKNGFYYDNIDIRIRRNDVDSLFIANISSNVSPLFISGKHADPRINIRKRPYPPEYKKKKSDTIPLYDTIINNISIPNAELFLAMESRPIDQFTTDSSGYFRVPDTLKSGIQYALLQLETEDIVEEDIEHQIEEELTSQDTIISEPPPKNEELALTDFDKTDTITENEIGKDSLRISGRVIDQENKGIPDVKIKVFSEENLEAESKSDTLGDYDIKVPEKENYAVNMNKEGFYKEQITLTKEEVIDHGEQMTVTMPPIEKNKPFELKNIFFDLDKSTLRNKSVAELSHITDFMLENPDVIIQLSAHTDTRGNYYYNIKLSEDRAASVREYLINHDIDVQRIISHGFGEAFPVEKNAKSESEHELNRRVEFSVYQRRENDIWNLQANQPLNIPGFSILNYSDYQSDGLITEKTPLPRGVFYRIKLAEFSHPVDYSTFKGLFPLVKENDIVNNTQEYYTGLFMNYEDAQDALKIIRKSFFDAYIMAYLNNEHISIARSLEIQGRSNEMAISQEGNNKENSFVKTSYPIFSVQVGAYKRSPDDSRIKELRNMAGDYSLIEIDDKKNTVYSIGKFDTYEEAFIAKQKIMNENGIADAFIIAILDGEKISINEANRILATR